jgi:hypothetical protein
MENKKPTRELTIGEIVSQTFAIYSQKFTQYLIPFLIAGAITGLFTMAIGYAIKTPTLTQLPPNPTTEQIAEWMSQLASYLSAVLAIAFLTGIIGWIIGQITQGISVKFTADTLEKGQANLQTSFNYTITKLLSLLAVSIITGILIIVGLIAFIIPGIILAIMFSLVVPTIIIENTGALESLSRSRRLVSHRWLKTFGLLLLLYIIIIVAGVLIGMISIPFREASALVSSILNGFIQPILPIGFTLYYYSMIARTTPQEQPQPTQTP